MTLGRAIACRLSQSCCMQSVRKAAGADACRPGNMQAHQAPLAMQLSTTRNIACPAEAGKALLHLAGRPMSKMPKDLAMLQV